MTTKRIETNNGTLALTVETDGSGYNWVKIPLGTSTSGGTSGTVFYNRKVNIHMLKSNSNNDGIFIESDSEICCALPGGYNVVGSIGFDLGIKFDKIAYENVNIYNWGAGDPILLIKMVQEVIGVQVEIQAMELVCVKNLVLYTEHGKIMVTSVIMLGQVRNQEAPTTITNGATRFGMDFVIAAGIIK